MTTYAAITSGQVDAESIIDTVLAGQWTDNVLAIQEADGSAPAIVGLLETSHIAIADGVTRRFFQTISVNHLIFLTSGAWVLVAKTEWVVPRTGTYTLKFDIRDTDASTDTGDNTGNVQARFYKDAATGYSGFVATGTTQSEGDGNFVTKTQTGIALNAGDVVAIYVNDNTGPRISIKNIIWSAGVKLFG